MQQVRARAADQFTDGCKTRDPLIRVYNGGIDMPDRPNDIGLAALCVLHLGAGWLGSATPGTLSTILTSCACVETRTFASDCLMCHRAASRVSLKAAEISSTVWPSARSTAILASAGVN